MIYLASQSPRRQQLLDQLDIAFEPLLPETAAERDAAEALEQRIGNESPRRYVMRVTRLKLEAAIQRLRHRRLPERPVLCADTTVALGNTIYGKPITADEAAAMLNALSDRTHRVLTAVAIGDGQRMLSKLSISQVRFAPLDEAAIAAYIATGEPFGKAGAYGIQGQAARFIASINGSYSGIMGLPLFETAALLTTFVNETNTKPES